MVASAWAHVGIAVAACVLLLALGSLVWLAVSVRGLPGRVEVRDSMRLDWYLDERCQTGDLLFFRNPGADWLHRLVSPMTHVAMVVVDSATGQPWVVEMHDAEEVEGRRSGVHMQPARERLAGLDEDLVVAQVRTPLDGNRASAFVASLADVPYRDGLRTHVAKCKLLPWYPDRRSARDGMMCSEFCLYVLNELGALRHDWRCVTPSDLQQLVASSDAYRPPLALLE